MLNTIHLQGRLIKNPELRETANGTKYCSICIASSRGKNDETDFLNAIAWSGRAEFIEKYFHKGDMILISGRLQSRNYEDKDGNKRTAYDISISEVNFCGGGKKSDEPATGEPVPPPEPPPEEVDGLPFEI